MQVLFFKMYKIYNFFTQNYLLKRKGEMLCYRLGFPPTLLSCSLRFFALVTVILYHCLFHVIN